MFKSFVKAKVTSIKSSIEEAIISFDPETATEAAILQIEEKFDELNLAFSKSKQVAEKEKKESDAIVNLYNQRLLAAEFLQQDQSKAEALEKFVAQLEDMQQDVEREQQEALDAAHDMKNLEDLVHVFSDKLRCARATVERAKKDMQRAKVAEESAKQKEEAAKVTSGLSKGTAGLSSALDHMTKLAEDSKAKAEAATRKAQLLQPTAIEDDPDIKAALAAINNEPSATTSISDRLSALKRRNCQNC